MPEQIRPQFTNRLRRFVGLTAVGEYGSESLDDPGLEGIIRPIEKELANYADALATYVTLTTVLINDDNISDLMEGMIAEQKAYWQNNRSQRRINFAQTKELYPLFVQTAIMSTRIFASKKEFALELAGDQERNIISLINTARTQFKDHFNRIEGKRLGLFQDSLINRGLATRSFESEIASFQKSIFPTCKKMSKNEISIFQSLWDNTQVLENPARFIEDIILQPGSGEVSSPVRTLISLLATEHYLNGPDSVVSMAVASMQERASNGYAIAEEFITKLIYEDPAFNYIFDRIEGEPAKKLIIGDVVRGFADWPPSMKQDYSDYMKARISTLKTQLDKALTPYIRKEMLMPTFDDFEDAVDRLYRRVFGQKGIPDSHKKPPSTIQRKVVRAEDVIPTERGEHEHVEKQLYVKYFVNSPGKGFILADDSNRLAKEIKVVSGSDGLLADDIVRIIKILSADPMNHSKQVKQRTKKEGVPIRFRTSNIRQHMKGEGFSRRVDKYRIVFFIDGPNKTLGIVGIFADHDKYEKFLDTLPRTG
ncbi:MAG TPA: hypothetical protein VGA08_00825 [Candidatus Saccharimonadales bacterium]